MSETSAVNGAGSHNENESLIYTSFSRSPGLIAAIAWRNLWRNRRRTLLSAGGIAFAVVLLMFSRSMQLGSYTGQIEATTAMLHGHAQIQHAEYLDDPKLEYLVVDADVLAASLAERPRVVLASPRAAAFALMSVGEKSFGAQVLGVVPQAERQLSKLPAMVAQGRYLAGGNEAYVGSALAKNLRAAIGDELLVLGSGLEGGVAALALTIVGVFDSGHAGLDRSLVEVPLEVFREGFFLGDAAHQIALKFNDIGATQQVVDEINGSLPAGLVARPWQQLMPEVVQGIALDRISARLMYAILTVIVLFSVVNAFIMTVFERVPEFGMLKAIGMRPWRIIAMLQLEALWLSILGSLLGIVLAVPILAWLILEGIPVEQFAEMVQNLVLPTHIKGAFDVWEFAKVPLLFVVGCQVAAFLPALRIRRLQPVEALRVD